jgi:hypothetical protein
MSKNLTRKGLALAAIAALGVSVFAGAPAFAGVENTKVTLAPNAGTTYNSIIGAGFALKTELDPTLASIDLKTVSKLSYLILNSGAAQIKATLDGSSTGTVTPGAISWDTADAAGDLGVEYTAKTYKSLASASAYTKAKAILVRGNVGNTADASDLGKSVLTVNASLDATADVSVTVQAWIDDNADGIIGTNEYTSPVRTIKFIPAANATVTTTLKSAAFGGTSLKAKVVIGGDINQENLTTQVKVGFFADGSKKDLTTGNSLDTVADAYLVAASYDSTEAGLLNLNSTVGPLAVADYTVQAYLNNVDNTLNTKLGSLSSASRPAAGTVTSADNTDSLETVGSLSVVGQKSGNTSAGATVVKSGYTGDISFKSTVNNDSVGTSTDVQSDTVAAAVTVRVTLSKVTGAFDAASTFTAGGVTLTATSGAVYFDTTTTTAGAIAFTGKSTTGTKGDKVNVQIQVLKDTTGYGTADAQVLTWTDAAADKVVLTNASTSASSGNRAVHVARGGSFAAEYSVLDQFGGLWTTAGYRLDITGTDIVLHPAVVAGKVSATITDVSTSAGHYDVVATLSKLVSTTWTQQTPATTVVVYSDALVAKTVTAVPSVTDAVATITSALVSVDLRVSDNGTTPATIGYSNDTQDISGRVTDAAGYAIVGEKVTLTGAGLAFVVVTPTGYIYSVGSATVNTDTTGSYVVRVFSNASGTKAITVTAGAATATASIKFTGVTAVASTNVVTIDAPALTQVGRASTVTIKVVDKFGNAVSAVVLPVAVTGAGSLSSASVTTGLDGTATVQFVAGANDFGDAVITAKYTATDAAAAVVSATKTITVGITDAQVDIVNNRVTAVSSFTKGRTVSFYVDGLKKWSKTSASDADVVLNYNLKKGTHTVTVKISGGFVTTEKFIVK